jgi:hypothetical protein
LRIGIYHDKQLLKQYQNRGKTSDLLPKLFDEILQNYYINNLYYAKGPGSFMAIKVTYVFLRTLSVTQNIPLFATEGFTFNDNQPIKATGALYFLKKDGKILTKKIDAPNPQSDFILPQTLEPTLFTDDVEPLYVLPAV